MLLLQNARSIAVANHSVAKNSLGPNINILWLMINTKFVISIQQLFQMKIINKDNGD